MKEELTMEYLDGVAKDLMAKGAAKQQFVRGVPVFTMEINPNIPQEVRDEIQSFLMRDPE